jgi:hypothetical protein
MNPSFEIQSPTRVCAETGLELKVGEPFYGVLMDQDGKFLRKDYSLQAWKQPPAGALAYWRGKIPSKNQPQRPVIQDDLLHDCFDHLAESGEPHRQAFRYVVGLLLMRRKRLKFEDTRRDARGQEWLVVRDSRTGKKVEIADPVLSDDEILQVQDEIARVLGWDH